ncbi:MAG: glycosidase, partial [Candidatus Dormibacteraceae bacterium]
MKSIRVERSSITLHPDPSRVLLRPFHFMSDQRAISICQQVINLPESEIHILMDRLLDEFGGRHRRIREFFNRRFDEVKPYLASDKELSEDCKLLLGGYFSHEYSLESAALFNPSIVPHPDQSDLPSGSLRFILSLRATGEGHISSITFRTGCLDANCNITIDPPGRYSLEPATISSAVHEKPRFERQLNELRLGGGFSLQVLRDLEDTFTLDELLASIDLAVKQLRAPNPETEAIAREILLLAQSNYEVQFAADSGLSERVLFPATPSQSNGIEDARFVLFQGQDGRRTYYATYTAYDGRRIQPQFLETSDFLNFKFITLSGPAVENKGMALFPRKINGLYAMLGRQDYENIYVMFSGHLHFWHTAQLLLKPVFPW